MKNYATKTTDLYYKDDARSMGLLDFNDLEQKPIKVTDMSLYYSLVLACLDGPSPWKKKILEQ